MLKEKRVAHDEIRAELCCVYCGSSVAELTVVNQDALTERDFSDLCEKADGNGALPLLGQNVLATELVSIASLERGEWKIFCFSCVAKLYTMLRLHLYFTTDLEKLDRDSDALADKRVVPWPEESLPPLG